MEQQLRLGNIYLSDVTPMSYYREEVLRSALDNIRLYVVGVCFLLFNVLLGVVGTFWFRARQRIPEIGCTDCYFDGSLYGRPSCV